MYFGKISTYTCNQALKFHMQALFLMQIQNLKSDFRCFNFLLFLGMNSETNQSTIPNPSDKRYVLKWIHFLPIKHFLVYLVWACTSIKTMFRQIVLSEFMLSVTRRNLVKMKLFRYFQHDHISNMSSSWIKIHKDLKFPSKCNIMNDSFFALSDFYIKCDFKWNFTLQFNWWKGFRIVSHRIYSMSDSIRIFNPKILSNFIKYFTKPKPALSSATHVINLFL